MKVVKGLAEVRKALMSDFGGSKSPILRQMSKYAKMKIIQKEAILNGPFQHAYSHRAVNPIKWVRDLQSKVLKSIEYNKSKDKKFSAYGQLLYDGEKFQITQKGPICGITPLVAQDVFEKIAIRSSKDYVTNHGRELRKVAGVQVYDMLKKSFNDVKPISIDLLDDLLEYTRTAFPSNTARGYSTFAKGSKIGGYIPKSSVNDLHDIISMKRYVSVDTIRSKGISIDDSKWIEVTTDMLVRYYEVPANVDDALKRLEEMRGIVSGIGFRFQAKYNEEGDDDNFNRKDLQYKTDPKFRVVNLIPTTFQIITGIFCDAFIELAKAKKVHAYNHLQSPLVRKRMIQDFLDDANMAKGVLVPLDESSHDMDVDLDEQFGGFKIIVRSMVRGDDVRINRFLNEVRRLLGNQAIFAPDVNNDVQLIYTKTMLLSGGKGTNIVASTNILVFVHCLGLLAQERCRDEGGDVDGSFPRHAVAANGDDVLAAFPETFVDSLGGKEAFLIWLGEAAEQCGFEVNHIKQFGPSLRVTHYGQRYSSLDQKIFYEYSVNRCLGSMVFNEKGRRNIPEVTNWPSLEILGIFQIGNEVYQNAGEVSAKGIFQRLIIPEYLKIDHALLSLLQNCLKVTYNNVYKASNIAFSYLIKCAGGIDTVMRGLGVAGYDDKHLFELLGRSNTNDAVPFLVDACSIVSTMPDASKVKDNLYMEVFEPKTEVKNSILSEVIAETGTG